MYYLALASDYDGTLATDGMLDEPIIAAVRRLRETGRKVLLVTGREMDDLLVACPFMELFDMVVAENGAMLYEPATAKETLLAERPPERFVQLLLEQGIQPLGEGRVIVSTREPHEITVLNAIRELGLELQIIFNKGAVMVLPSGVNKASGLRAALDQMGLSPLNVVAVGDGENDHAFLAASGRGVAVQNALPMLKETADWVTKAARGAGVSEVIDRLITSDLDGLENRRHEILIGTEPEGAPVMLRDHGLNVLVSGTSGGGKTTLTTGILERMAHGGFQFCVLDPEGDYDELEGAVVVGDGQNPPSVGRVLALLNEVGQNAIINLSGMTLGDRPAFLARLMPQLQELRAKFGRPHWIVVDEAHHMLPASWDPATLTFPYTAKGMLLVTVHPDQVSPAVLREMDALIALGQTVNETMRSFCGAIEREPPIGSGQQLATGEAVFWDLHGDSGPRKVRIEASKSERKRHARKYAEGDLGSDRSFYFRGPEEKLKLMAQNLIIFIQMAEGVDADTWAFHLKRHDYSNWLRGAIKDEELAGVAQQIEDDDSLSPEDSRKKIRAAIEERYTAPA